MTLHKLVMTYGCNNSGLAEEFKQEVEALAKERGLENVAVRQGSALLEPFVQSTISGKDNDVAGFDSIVGIESGQILGR